MRKIKLRAWDKEAESYVESGFDFRVDGNGCTYRRAWGETVWDRTTKLILELSTGFTDKEKGEDIYYNDIYYHAGLKMNMIVDDLCVAHWEVDLDRMNYTQPKIIGNKHQNPELLEKT